MIKTAIAFLLGCQLCLHLSELPGQAIWFCLPALLAALCWRQVVVSSFIVGLLWSGYQAQYALTDRLNEQQAGQDTIVTGFISSIPQQHAHVLRFDFSPDSESLPSRISLSWYYPPSPIPKAGERWQLNVRLKPPHGMMNPGGFDYEGWLFANGIGASGYIRQQGQNQRLEPASWHSVEHWRQQIQTELIRLMPEARQLPLLLGLSVGLRDQLSPANWELLKVTGTSHLLAISGLHIGLAALLGFWLFRGLWSLIPRALLLLPAQQAGALGGVAMALFYALLAGLSIPTQRAMIMVVVVMTSLMLKRPLYPSHVLALSLLLVLLYDPMAAIAPGFWLSFTAVTIILLTCTNRFPPRRLTWLGIHFWIAFGLIPMLLLFFGQFSLISPLANLIAVPLVSFVIVPLILLGMLLLFVSSSLAGNILWLADQALNLLWHWLSLASSSQPVHWQTVTLPLLTLAMLMPALWLLLLPRGIPARWLGLIAVCPMLVSSNDTIQYGHFRFALLDVGQGLSAVIETRHHVLVFDTGPRFSDRFNTGSAVVSPYLRFRNRESVDTLIVSHADNDHIGGVEGLTKDIPIKRILTSNPETLLNAETCQAGQQWQWDGVSFLVLQPFSGQQGSKNNLSCVVKVSSNDISVLLTGDIEQESEQWLVKRYGQQLQSDILLVPHHGSRTSSSNQFIEAVSPKSALVSVGYRNRYHFPVDNIVARYQERGISWLRTDLEGAIIFDTSAADVLKPVRWRHYVGRLWTWKATE